MTEKFPPFRLDAVDRRLLNLLQQDAKTPVQELADQLKLSKTPVYERIKRLEKEGYIDRYVALVNRKRTKAGIMVFVNVTLEQQKLQYFTHIRDAIDQMPEVLEAYKVGGGTDFMLKVVVSDLDGYYDFASKKLANLPHIGQISSSFVLKEIKSTTAIDL